MRGYWQAMKVWAIMRHTVLVGLTHGHNKLAFRLELEKHIRFIDRVYSMVGV